MTTPEAIAATATLAAAAAGAAAYASMWPASQLFGAVVTAAKDPNQFALTYDDGPNPAVTPHLLDVLAARNVKATFFLIGNFVRQEPELTRELARQGHLVGCHTMTHPHLPFCGAARIRQELADCQSLIEDTIGKPVTWFRPPFGQRRPAVLRIARELGMASTTWNIIVGDWNPIPAETILARIERGVARNRAHGRGSNICLHDGGQGGLGQTRMPSVEATRRLIEAHPEAGWVTLDAWR
ncbi:Peptidoglycan/xylan/chitin deacetylase, PgdA/CDA1 family [Granulicella rosea]|uniref:Peptidoglycan/xylan/chitin deacetylase, PgdA/CDA1 family n=1 Tax=Granulicella rosea TaxID=474952 RepID=A0A239LL46_9BACT|nr:polysaccharide deacetylase family protein [Granulicella rosea]SNT30632.1 Peptidoglycan/xylan/chitin deacetylase, PgdA/CDA1 family [Granulicella rosea]